MTFFVRRLVTYLPKLNHRIWILMVGRLLSQLGTGFVLFYAPIFFVNQVGLSTVAVGIGLGSESISGVFGRILGGTLADSPRWGRRKTLLVAAVISALADLVLALSHDFPSFLLGNLLMGLGIGLYWPATESVVADLTTGEERNEAYALTRLSDSVGLGLGVVLGGWLIAASHAYRALFIIDGISFVIFFGIIYWAIAETLSPQPAHQRRKSGWATALRDRILLIYVSINILFTTYLALVNSALPLYLNNHSVTPSGQGFSPTLLSMLFSWYVILSALCQLPVARWLNRFSRPHALIISAFLWAIGFVLIWGVGLFPAGSIAYAAAGLGIMALATVAYTPAASSLVVGLAPVSMRGVYLSVNSLCWAVGYFIGPTLGGWAMGQSTQLAQQFWLVAAVSVAGVVAVLQVLDRLIRVRDPERNL